jgi:protoporphyrinogen IX oxidase
LMVYHCDAVVGSVQDETFNVMERRLVKAIMRPAAVVALITGLGLIHSLGLAFVEIWLLVKLSAVVAMFVVHALLERHVADFALGLRAHSGRYFRVLNEAPTILMVVIVIMVVVKPFV